MSGLMVTGVTITPIAVKDAPLLNSVGVHQPYQLRSIAEVHTDAGITGLAEAYGDDPTLENLHKAAGELTGLDAFDTNGLSRRVALALGQVTPVSPTELVGAPSVAKTVASTASALEVALFDAQGRALGRRVCDLLGGAVREAVPFSGYLFYKWAGHPGQEPDRFGAALDPDGIVPQAKWLGDTHGVGSLKPQGGGRPAAGGIPAIPAPRAAVPGHPPRVGPHP